MVAAVVTGLNGRVEVCVDLRIGSGYDVDRASDRAGNTQSSALGRRRHPSTLSGYADCAAQFCFEEFEFRLPAWGRSLREAITRRGIG